MGKDWHGGKGDTPRYHEGYKASKLWCKLCGFILKSEKCKDKCHDFDNDKTANIP